MDAAEVVRDLSSQNDIPMPQTERQAREKPLTNAKGFSLKQAGLSWNESSRSKLWFRRSKLKKSAHC
jgi:hypothetical protein